MRIFLWLINLLSILTIHAQVGIGTERPHPSAALDITSTTKGLLPPRMTREQVSFIEKPAGGLLVYCTDCKPKGLYNYDGTDWYLLGNKGDEIGDMQYWSGTRWSRIPGGAATWILTMSEAGIPSWNIAVGSRGPAGGIVFYDKGAYSNGWRYMEAAPNDQSTGSLWGCYGTSIPGVFGTAIGSGQANTTSIVNGCSDAGIAARICDDLVLNGYTDWFLPSIDELRWMTTEKYLIKSFSSYGYWSSSQINAQNAWGLFFNTGGSVFFEKNDGVVHVRAIRVF